MATDSSHRVIIGKTVTTLAPSFLIGSSLFLQVTRTTKGSILQYARPSLSYHFSLRPLFCPYLDGGRFTQVLLCIENLIHWYLNVAVTFDLLNVEI